MGTELKRPVLLIGFLLISHLDLVRHCLNLVFGLVFQSCHPEELLVTPAQHLEFFRNEVIFDSFPSISFCKLDIDVLLFV